MRNDNKRPRGNFSGKPGRPQNPKAARRPQGEPKIRKDRDDDFRTPLEEENAAFIAGRNAVIEALKANPSADTLFVEKGPERREPLQDHLPCQAGGLPHQGGRRPEARRDGGRDPASGGRSHPFRR